MSELEKGLTPFFRFNLDTSKMRRAMDRFACSISRMGESWAGRPVPPMPRRFYQGTARQYRADRRRYRRELDARKKETR